MSLRGLLSLDPSWQSAAITAACLLVLAAVARLVPRLAARPRVGTAAAVAQELGTLTVLFALYRLAGEYSVLGLGDALNRGDWIWHAERVLHLPSEAAVQAVFLPHPLIVQGFNLFYAILHFTALLAWLTWLFFRHRDHYRQWRSTLVLLTFFCLLVQLVPVAPPRMLPARGLVDTGLVYGQSVYGSDAGFKPDQLSAMPSVHIGWAVLIALAVIFASRSRWCWLILVYPVATTLAVIVTANHFWLDGIAAVGLLALSLLAQMSARKALRAMDAAGRIPQWAAWLVAPSPAIRHVVPSELVQPPVAARHSADFAPINRQQPNGHPAGSPHLNGQPAARVNGARVNTQHVNGQLAGGPRVNGSRVNGHRVNGDRMDGDRVNGECRLNWERVNGHRVNGLLHPRPANPEVDGETKPRTWAPRQRDAESPGDRLTRGLGAVGGRVPPGI